MFSFYEANPTRFIIYTISLIFLFLAVYRAFLRPLRSIGDYFQRAHLLSKSLKAHKMARNVLERAEKLPGLTTFDRQALEFQKGMTYYYQKDYITAAQTFDRMLPYFDNKDVNFDAGYPAMVISYYNSGRVQEARTLYHKLLKHRKNDERFGILTTLDQRIFK